MIILKERKIDINKKEEFSIFIIKIRKDEYIELIKKLNIEKDFDYYDIREIEENFEKSIFYDEDNRYLYLNSSIERIFIEYIDKEDFDKIIDEYFND